MIVTNIAQSYPSVLAGTANLQAVTMGSWAAVSEADLQNHADVVVGVHKNTVVSAYDVTSWTHSNDGRVTFAGVTSQEFAYLIGQAAPCKPWVRGAARPIKVIDTDAVRGTVVTPSSDTSGRLQALLGEAIITVELDGAVTVHVPAGTPVTVVTKVAEQSNTGAAEAA